MASSDDKDLQIAQRWCVAKGSEWAVTTSLGKGGTAPVFEITSPFGPRALKIYDSHFSAGEMGIIQQKRIDQQLALTGHDCKFLVQVYEGGRFEDRLFLLMSRAPGTELAKCLGSVPRPKIRQIMGQITQAAMFLKTKSLCHRDIKAANIFISDDFEHCTLLDISVVRDISDPIGIGTDHDGQLPVVATARYSPPEYLFRLLEPGPELWHALNIYQLGALLHDLIMKEPLFEAEYLKSSENRYRFAWIVATVDPILHANDVDRDLTLIAHRALDKDWKRRSQLALDDFLADPRIRQSHALQVIGLTIGHDSTHNGDTVALQLQRVREVSTSLEEAVVQHLRTNGVTAIHGTVPGLNDTSKRISFRWEISEPANETTSQQLELELNLSLLVTSGVRYFGLRAILNLAQMSIRKTASLSLPDSKDEPGVELHLLNLVVGSIEKLAVDITSGDAVKVGA